jgi:hypothetical protein
MAKKLKGILAQVEKEIKGSTQVLLIHGLLTIHTSHSLGHQHCEDA